VFGCGVRRSLGHDLPVVGLRRAGLVLAVAAGCFGLARLGLLTVSRETRTVALWPTGGFLLGVLLVCERREWPWLALAAAAGSAGAQVVAGRSVPVAHLAPRP
jgi:integral membrane sensor domain MASE1